jgi:hypothetical protein
MVLKKALFSSKLSRYPRKKNSTCRMPLTLSVTDIPYKKPGDALVYENESNLEKRQICITWGSVCLVALAVGSKEDRMSIRSQTCSQAMILGQKGW